ncbi:MAG: T9SS type A sorting domain-containing protein, partial [Bacteroidota bacterium]
DVVISVKEMVLMPHNLFVYLLDKKTGIHQNLAVYPEYRTGVDAGENANRFSVVLSHRDLRFQPGIDESYHVYSFRNRVYVYLNLPAGENSDMRIFNIMGQQVLQKSLDGNGYHETDLTASEGIYVVTLSSANGRFNKKVYISNQW